jgi:hypothetical protein
MIVLGVILLVLGVGLLIFAVYELREKWRQWKENENKKCIALLELLFSDQSARQLAFLAFLLTFVHCWWDIAYSIGKSRLNTGFSFHTLKYPKHWYYNSSQLWIKDFFTKLLSVSNQPP